MSSALTRAPADELGVVLPRTETGATVDAVRHFIVPRTSFFSAGPLAEALDGHLLPRLLEQHRPTRTIRIWSAACASGQEPYSVAMLLSDALPIGWRVDILATDLSEAMVRRTFQGNYSDEEVHTGLSEDHRVRYFEQFDDRWLIDNSVRQWVTASRLDLRQPLPPMPPFDIILLRNVLPHLEVPTRVRLLEQIRQHTRRGGFLILDQREYDGDVDHAWRREIVAGHPVFRHEAAVTPLP